MRRRAAFALTLALIALQPLLGSCAAPPRTVTVAAYDFMDTVSTVTLYERDADKAERVFGVCRALDDLLDMRDPLSEISRVNNAGGKRVPVSPDTESVLKTGIEAAGISGGMFDITIGRASALWDFAAGTVPDKAALDDAVAGAGIGGLTVEDGTASIIGGMIDTGALAKGYALDVVRLALDDEGVASALINLGGSVLAKGTRPGGGPWRVGIQKPFGGADELLGVVEASDVTVVTAGLYQRSFESGGVLYHHILDPRDGMPVKTDVWSATIIADSGVWADAYSTICVLLGSREAMSFIEDIDGVECVLALSDGSTLFSGGIGSRVTFSWAE
ncbi:MAG: FAD:protein FMN transferase [Oscillospiraceae bacterium]|jgi:thiamine biosynthesis lipoprotein|nr:FAD:protein FMN transferase [Oscillospiraceae bacterium]